MAWYDRSVTNPDGVSPLPHPRATIEDVIPQALALFDQGERVDMNSLAMRLGIGRATLYRWVGDREHVLDRVILTCVQELWAGAQPRSRGQGIDRALSTVRLFLRDSTAYAPLRDFAQREPNLALRVLLNEDGEVNHAIRWALALEVTAYTALEVPDETFAVLALTATALVWASVAAGREPAIEATVTIMRTVLTATDRS